MLEVAVIGAGTSGLVAARHLIQAGLRPTIFEAAKTIGGAWTPHKSSSSSSPSTSSSPSLTNNEEHRSPIQNGNTQAHTKHHPHHHSHPASKMWNGMTTNISKYTCQFSDFPWPEGTGTFPSVEEMHEYLESYSDTFLTPSSSFTLKLECEVTSVEQLETAGSKSSSSSNSGNGYKVEWIDLQTQEKITCSQDFGGIVVASGFFNAPRWPSFMDKGFIDMNNKSDNKPRIIHSHDYVSHDMFRNRNVAVVGASFSALEIAADVSQSASRVVNIMPSVPWILPRWIPRVQSVRSNQSLTQTQSSFGDSGVGDESSTITILPNDLALYQRSGPFPKTSEPVLTPDSCRLFHKYVKSIVGNKQLNSPLGEPSNWDQPPFVAISDDFVDLVKEGKIEVLRGRLTSIMEDGKLKVTPSGNSSKESSATEAESILLEDIDHIICCTGYAPHLHRILSPSILSVLDYDKNSSYMPASLAWDTLHPALPNMAFCGMYRRPYMGVTELQARLAASIFSESLTIDASQYESALDTSRRIRTAYPRTQCPYYDYVSSMDALAQLCFKGDCPKFNIGKSDIVLPPFYQANEELSQKCLSELEKEIQHGQSGSRMPALVMQSILGKWSFERYIMHLQTNKVERVSGTVKYTKYSKKTSPKTTEDTGKAMDFLIETNDNPVLYREDGFYELSPTQKLEVFREYEYVCKYDALEIYFVEGGKRAHLFLSLKFVPESTSTQQSSRWVKATSDHLCIKDLYSATFRVNLDGLSASEIVIKYRVKGPSKDYESTTILKPLHSWQKLLIKQ